MPHCAGEKSREGPAGAVRLGELKPPVSRVDLSVDSSLRCDKVNDVYIPRFRDSKGPRGFAFVRFHYETDGRAAIGVLNGKKIDGREVSVQVANPKSNVPKLAKSSRPNSQQQRPLPSFNHPPTRARLYAETIKIGKDDRKESKRLPRLHLSGRPRSSE
ncbi:serine/arginine-rich splicing factor SC35-like [Magnolia sinica]|uniref:serine/arginine-rich splicing factor SC35-like n=1 Tax=Magnolia sinica TaxID=86752 RepID=UPI002658DE2A|nr:serine/arginine-rich splicing factor SC35-like [Magnolia sinica]